MLTSLQYTLIFTVLAVRDKSILFSSFSILLAFIHIVCSNVYLLINHLPNSLQLYTLFLVFLQVIPPLIILKKIFFFYWL